MSTACIDLVRKDVEDMTDEELDSVLDMMRARQERLIAGGEDPNKAAARAGMDVADLLRAAAEIEKRNEVINRRVRLEATDYIRTTWKGKEAEGVLAMLYGSSHARLGSRASVNAAQSALFRRYLSSVESELEQAGLFDVLRRGELDREVFSAMRSIKDEAALRKLPGQAVAIARILDKWQEVARVEANRAGAWIGKVDDYGLKQTHNADRIARAGEAEWTSWIKDRLDLDRIFPDGAPKNFEHWLHETYLNLTTGVRPEGGAPSERMAAFKGPGNLAKRLSQERVLHFKTPDDAFDYNERFGMGNVREAFVTGLHRSAESTGMMQVLGTNPEYNLRSIVDQIREDLRSDPKALAKFDDATRRGVRIDNAIRELSGITRRVASQRLAAVGGALRVFNTLTGLGGAVVSAVTDVPTRASLLRYQGQSYLGELVRGLVSPIERIAAGADSAEKRAVLSAAGYFNEIAIGNLVSRFSPDDNLPGRMQKAVHTFFKWNLLSGWTDGMRRSTLESMAHYWGELAGKDWASLSERNRQALERFRITGPEWDAIAKGITDVEGRKFLTPEAVRALPLERFADLSKDRINGLKSGVAERLQRRMAMDERELGWVSTRASDLREGLATARDALNARIKTLEGAGRAQLEELGARLSKLEENIDYAEGFWQQRIDRGQDVGFYGKPALRDVGIDEGRAREAAKQLRSVSRQVGRDVEKAKSLLNESFVRRWSDREDDFKAFAEGIDQRVRERSELNAKDLATLEPKINRILDDTRERMAMRLQQFYADDLDSAVISPDARTLAFMRQGTQAGTPIGEVLRAFWQFKSFGIAMMQRGFLREFNGYGPRGGISRLAGLGLLMAGSMGFGYMAMAMKDLLRGKTPRPVDDPRTWASAAAQGGALGIYGDFLFGSARTGSGFLATLGGPTVGKLDNLAELFQRAKNGDDVGASALRFLINNTPYNNLFYARIAADYLFLYELQEAMNPGYLRRMERRSEQDTGSSWYLRPSEFAR